MSLPLTRSNGSHLSSWPLGDKTHMPGAFWPRNRLYRSATSRGLKTGGKWTRYIQCISEGASGYIHARQTPQNDLGSSDFTYSTTPCRFSKTPKCVPPIVTISESRHVPWPVKKFCVPGNFVNNNIPLFFRRAISYHIRSHLSRDQKEIHSCVQTKPPLPLPVNLSVTRPVPRIFASWPSLSVVQ